MGFQLTFAYHHLCNTWIVRLYIPLLPLTERMECQYMVVKKKNSTVHYYMNVLPCHCLYIQNLDKEYPFTFFIQFLSFTDRKVLCQFRCLGCFPDKSQVVVYLL